MALKLLKCQSERHDTVLSGNENTFQQVLLSMTRWNCRKLNRLRWQLGLMN
jgi:hypothetical protein